MDFLKKHYEKILLVLVLLGVALAVGFLPFKIASDRKDLEDKSTMLITPRVAPLTNLDLSIPEQASKRLAAPILVDLGPPNRLFNPMPWQKAADNRLIPMEKVGPTRLVVTNIVPLYLRLTLDNVQPSDSGVKYVVGIEKQAAANPNQRGKQQKYCKLNDKNDTFQLVDVKGKPEDPQLVLILNDSGEKAIISTNQPFRRVDGYMADLRYDLENKRWSNRRVNSQPPLTFNGEEYNIVAINKNEVVLSAKSNQKKWTIKALASSTP